MTTTINASTSAGLVNTADTSGVLQLQTNSTTAVTIDTSQQVGIGQTPIASTSPLQVKGGCNPAIVARKTSDKRCADYDDGRLHIQQ